MKKHLILNLSVWLGAIAFNALFWGEAMGLNTLLFTLLALIALFTLHPESRRSRSVLLLAGGLVTCAILVVWNNSLLAKERELNKLRFLTERVYLFRVP
ncbi:MAG: hypothetical protein ACI85O_003654 [Saprospiraceae bacterium]|jgi:hypothetical protein